MKNLKILYSIIISLIIVIVFLFCFIIFREINKKEQYDYPSEYVECYNVSIIYAGNYVTQYYTSKEYSDYEPYKEIWIKFDKDNYYLKLIDWDGSINEQQSSRYGHTVLVNYK